MKHWDYGGIHIHKSKSKQRYILSDTQVKYSRTVKVEFQDALCHRLLKFNGKWYVCDLGVGHLKDCKPSRPYEVMVFE